MLIFCFLKRIRIMKRNFLGKVVSKSELAKMLVVDHKKMYDGVFKDLKDWIDVKKAIQPNRLPCSEVSKVMGTG